VFSNETLDDSYDLFDFDVFVTCVFAGLIYVESKSLVHYMIQDCVCVMKCEEFPASLVLGDLVCLA